MYDKKKDKENESKNMQRKSSEKSNLQNSKGKAFRITITYIFILILEESLKFNKNVDLVSEEENQIEDEVIFF